MTWAGRALAKFLLLWLCSVAMTTTAQTTIYVATGGGNSPPYGSWADAATDINVGVGSAVAGDTVIVSNGNYAATNQLAVGGFTVQSLNGPGSTLVYRPDSAGTTFAIFRVTNASALVRGFSITNGFWTASNDSGGSVHMTAGTVSNCWIVNTRYIGGTQSGAVWMNAGLLTTCILSNCVPRTYALRMYGGVVENCTLTKNNNPYDTDAPIDVYGGIMRRCRIYGNSAGGSGSGAMRLTAGLVENCVIYANKTTSGSQAGGVELAGGRLVHCTIAANTNAAGATGAGVERGSGVMTNCVVYGNSGSGVDYSGSAAAAYYSCSPQLTHGSQGNITNNPQFTSMAAGNCTLVRGSPCMDTGTTLADVTRDLILRARPQDGDGAGGAVSDMGCYEVIDPSLGPIEVSFTGTPTYGLAPLQVVFTVSMLGSNQTVTWYGWDFDNDGNWNTNGTGLATVTNTYALGSYSVRVAVSNSANETSSCTNVGYVTVAQSAFYVANNGSHTAPYDTWAKAATNLHVALGLATNSGQTLWVSNGLYAVTNQISVPDLTVRSLNGPGYTTLYRPWSVSNKMVVVNHTNALVSGFMITNAYVNIYGAGQALELSAGTVSNCVITRCNSLALGGAQAFMVLVSGGVMTHCVISNNESRSRVVGVFSDGILQDSVLSDNTTPYDPATLYVSGSASTARRCRILRNTGPSGGAYIGWDGLGGRMENCFFWGNYGGAHGGALRIDSGWVVNCTVASNAASAGAPAGGLYRTGGAVTNCVVYGNVVGGMANNYGGTAGAAWYSCAPELTDGVQGNLNTDPKYVNLTAGDGHLQLGSPCVDCGVNLAGVTVDIDGTNRDANCDMGAFERVTKAGALAADFVGSPLAGIGSVTSVFRSVFDGDNTNIAWYGWDFDNNGTFDLVGPGLRVVTNVYAPGRYTVCLLVTNTALESAAYTNLTYVSVQSAGNDVYVATNGPSVFPYDTWAKAASNLNEAVGGAAHGNSTVWVSNGVYGVTDRLALATNIVVRSINGPGVTMVYRNSAAGTGFPIFYLSHAGAQVHGLTLSNGCWGVQSGAGGAVTMTAGLVSNCVMVGTVADSYNNGVLGLWGGLVTGCLISNNTPRSFTVMVTAGVMEDTIVTRSTAGHDAAPLVIGYGNAGGTVRRCRIVNNTPPGNIAGGVQIHCRGRLENCLVYGNKAAASTYGAVAIGGAIAETRGGAMVNCTVVSNSTVSGAAGVTMYGGGTITNCIVYGNDAAFPNYSGAASNAWYSCAPELTHGSQGNITNNPQFTAVAAGDCTLLEGSACINTGTNIAWTASDIDLAGRLRILANTVDMGCYEAPGPPTGTLFMFL